MTIGEAIDRLDREPRLATFSQRDPLWQPADTVEIDFSKTYASNDSFLIGQDADITIGGDHLDSTTYKNLRIAFVKDELVALQFGFADLSGHAHQYGTLRNHLAQFPLEWAAPISMYVRVKPGGTTWNFGEMLVDVNEDLFRKSLSILGQDTTLRFADGPTKFGGMLKNVEIVIAHDEAVEIKYGVIPQSAERTRPQ